MTGVADAFLIAVDSVIDVIGRAEVAEHWESPSALAEWSVGGLAGHLAGQPFAGVALIEAEPSDLTPISLDEHYRRVSWIGAAVDDEVSVDIRSGGDANAEAGPPALLARLIDTRDRLGGLLTATTPERPVLVPWQGWALRRDDFLLMRMMEIAVHSDDLAASVGVAAPELPDEVLGPVLGLLTRLAVRRHGQSAVLAALTRAERAPARINAF
jgi:Mycothiol maleylpyruvate isomerase N-terminal domain